MKKFYLILVCLLLTLALASCQPQVIEHLPDSPTSVPGEPEGVPLGEINGSVIVWKG